jgi:hypothetical protein
MEKQPVAKPKCVFIGPHGQTEAETSCRKDLEILIKAAFEETHEVHPYWVLSRADMPTDIFPAIVSADLVVADLRGLNPNVMYEVGLRHAFNRPVLHLCDFDTELAWDIDKNFVVKYKMPIQLSHKAELVAVLRERRDKIFSIKKDRHQVFNSFIAAVGTAANLNALEVGADLKTFLANLQGQMGTLRRDVSAVISHVSAPPSPITGPVPFQHGLNYYSGLAGSESVGIASAEQAYRASLFSGSLKLTDGITIPEGKRPK